MFTNNCQLNCNDVINNFLGVNQSFLEFPVLINQIASSLSVSLSLSQCFQHGWYLATDFQMFIIGIALHLTMWRFPKSTKFLLVTSMIISYIIPGVVTYKNKFDGIIVIRPESQKYGMWFDDIYKKVYIPTHTNMGTYLAGMVAGLLYLKLKARQPNITETKVFKYTWYAILPTAFLLMMSAYWFYACELQKPQFWIAVYAAVMK